MERISNPYASPNESISESYGTQLPRFTAGLLVGAKWSLVFALPFSAWVFYTLYRINTGPITDHLTDAQVPNPLTFTSFVRCVAGALLIPCFTIVLPVAAASGMLNVLRDRPMTPQTDG